jgi:beta-glucosidase
MDPYKDPSKTIEDRVADLLQRMTLDEKMAQIRSVWSHLVMENSERFSRDKAQQLLNKGIGHITRPGGSTDLHPPQVATFVRETQRFLLENTRLGIPAIMHEECLMGYQTRDATIFPQIIGVASTWNPTVVEKMASVLHDQLAINGIGQALAPVLDIARDPRWGRVEETYGEDPCLVSVLGCAYIQGLQGKPRERQVAATAKHFVGYGLPQGGLNWAPARIPARELHETYLYPFEAAVRIAHVMSVMNGYHELDGIPCVASYQLLTTVLRDGWGFEGIVASDYDAIRMLKEYHRVVASLAEAGALALQAGIDIELPLSDCFNQELRERIDNGTVPVTVLDRAVSRVLRVKFQLGLFENPFPADTVTLASLDAPVHRRIAREVARESIVLLKNEGGFLPLRKDTGTITVVGPSADSWRALIGDYGYSSILEHRKLFDEHVPLESLARLPNPSVPVVTVLEGIKAQVAPTSRVIFAEGCSYAGTDKSGFAEAIQAAGQADVVIVVVGGKSGFIKDCTAGEERDSATLLLPGVQEDLILALAETGPPVVVVVVDGRPLVLERIVPKVRALVEAWLPGEEGGSAIADVLFGAVSPGGKLPITFPAHVGQVPVFYAHKPSAGKSHLWLDYTDAPHKPMFPFGFGLSYSQFEYSSLTISPGRLTAPGTVAIGFTVSNVGPVAADEVVQLYTSDAVASVTRPVKELKGFLRIHLLPGEKQRVEFRLPTELLAFYDKDMKLIVEPGYFMAMIGSSSDDIRLSGGFEVTGDACVLQYRTEFWAGANVNKQARQPQNR